ncbi:MAG: hypothetical protein H0U89_02925 [Acidimicrobiia bacterium]|nr:hypothetical protein [Acidimicrobiia bacterium]
MTAAGRSRWLLAAGLVALGLSAATPAAAQTEVAPGDDGPTVVITGRVTVAEGERTDAVVIADGPVEIAGRVEGPVIAANGDVRVTGTVDEDVVAFNGRAIIEDGARVGGGVVSSKEPRVASGATVEEDVEKVNFSNFFNSLGWVLWLLWWLAVTLSTLVLGLLLVGLFPRAAQATATAGRTRVGPCIGWGLLLAIGIPIVSVALFFTVLGIPLGLVGLAAVVPLYAVGYVAAALVLGRRIVGEPRSLLLAFVAGWGILRLIDLVPVLGNLVTTLATIYGLGALTVAAWRARSTRIVRDRAPEPVAA